ncbi:uncharacterized protein TNCV_3117531 [Trichonephila clavipes]|uniref:Uncharacterized protein n=1 Tax=Trichonephila clavipes TaxID=2585209 RepID=A0A8X6WA75_TRICX|nr:uncharacterized protein TNCV_3117531 [Trichonephila clavipes]
MEILAPDDTRCKDRDRRKQLSCFLLPSRSASLSSLCFEISRGTGEYFPPLQFHLQKLWRWRYRSCHHLSSLRGLSPSLNRTVTCMVLKANGRRTSCPCHDEFRGPRSDYVRQVALATTTTYLKSS